MRGAGSSCFQESNYPSCTLFNRNNFERSNCSVTHAGAIRDFVIKRVGEPTLRTYDFPINLVSGSSHPSSSDPTQEEPATRSNTHRFPQETRIPRRNPPLPIVPPILLNHRPDHFLVSIGRDHRRARCKPKTHTHTEHNDPATTTQKVESVRGNDSCSPVLFNKAPTTGSS